MNLYSTQFSFLFTTCKWKCFKLEKNFDNNNENVWNLNVKAAMKSNVFHTGGFDLDRNILDALTNYHGSNYAGNRM